MSDKTNGWLGPVERPIGSDPQHWSNGIHELVGHALDTTSASRDGEVALHHEMNACMIHGTEHAEDDVPGASLDPALVRQARDLDIQLFPTWESAIEYHDHMCGGD